jgi:hypothetical protein
VNRIATVAPSASCTETTNGYTPRRVGPPLITPVAPSSRRPGGNIAGGDAPRGILASGDRHGCAIRASDVILVEIDRNDVDARQDDQLERHLLGRLVCVDDRDRQASVPACGGKPKIVPAFGSKPIPNGKPLIGTNR